MVIIDNGNQDKKKIRWARAALPLVRKVNEACAINSPGAKEEGLPK